MNGLYTARAAIRQPAPACCWVVEHRMLAGVDDLYTARATILQLAWASCGVVAHRMLAGVDDLYTARAAIRQPALAGCGLVAHRKLAGVDDLYTARCSHPAADLLLAVGGTCVPLALAEALLYAGRHQAAGSCRLLVVGP